MVGNERINVKKSQADVGKTKTNGVDHSGDRNPVARTRALTRFVGMEKPEYNSNASCLRDTSTSLPASVPHVEHELRTMANVTARV